MEMPNDSTQLKIFAKDIMLIQYITVYLQKQIRQGHMVYSINE